MQTLPNEGDDVIVFRGSTEPWTIYLFAPNGACENLAGVDAATFVLAPAIDSIEDDLIVQFSLAEGDLSVHNGTDPKSDPSYIRMTPDADQAADIVAGVFLGIGNLRFGAGNWKPLDPVRVRAIVTAAIEVDP